jgi:hypothetical protein
MSRQNPTKCRSAWRTLCAGATLLVLLPVAHGGEDGDLEGPGPALSQPAPAAPTAPKPVADTAREMLPPPAPPEASRPRSELPAPSLSSPSSSSGAQDSLRSLEQRVAEMKDQVYRAKARLTLLSERHLRSTAGGGRAVVTQKTQMGRLYQPLRITYVLDGREVFNKGDEKSPLALTPAQLAELPVWDGGLKPGDHTLAVNVVYRGNGTPALSYFSQYTYTASAAQRFRASDGGVTRIRVVCREKGNPALTDVADRPFIEFVVDDGTTSSSSSGGSGAKVAAKASPLGSP